MDLKKQFKIPASAIALDIAGALLLAFGVMDLMQIEFSLFGFPSNDPRQGWTLVVFGVVFMIAATMLIVALLLAKRGQDEPPPTADSRHR